MDTSKIYYLILIVAFYFLVHSIRNLLQYFGIKSVLTRLGNHAWGVKIANFLLKPFGLRYRIAHEIYYFLFELALSIIFFTIFIKIHQSRTM